jgi:hypothetical protein
MLLEKGKNVVHPKSWILILTSIVLGFLIYYIVGKYSSYIFGPEHYKYSDCDVKYRQDYINWNGSSAFYPYNRWQADSAKTVFIKCLCDKYVLTKDTFIKSYVENAFRESEWYQSNYFENVGKLDTLFLMKYKDEIFHNDSRIYEAINKYRSDSIVLINILINQYRDNYNIRREYYNLILSKTEIVTIDTLIKYKKAIFKIPEHYGDA